MPFKSDEQRKWMHRNLPDIAETWENKYQIGGPVHGPSHDNGGVPIEVEGGEFVI